MMPSVRHLCLRKPRRYVCYHGVAALQLAHPHAYLFILQARLWDDLRALQRQLDGLREDASQAEVRVHDMIFCCCRAGFEEGYYHRHAAHQCQASTGEWWLLLLTSVGSMLCVLMLLVYYTYYVLRAGCVFGRLQSMHCRSPALIRTARTSGDTRTRSE